jgi:hypothetical protein
MVSALSGSELDWDLLNIRLPEIAFLLTLSSQPYLNVFEDSQGYLNANGAFGPLYSKDIQAETAAWKASLFLEGVDVLYVYGVGLGHYYTALEEWLRGGRERTLIFIEHDLSLLQTLFSLPIGKKILQDHQVHINYLPDLSSKSWEHVLDENVKKWISDRVDLTALSSYSKQQIKAKRLSLLRKSTLVHAGMSEFLHYHILMENIASNFLSVPSSFHANKWKDKFKGVPAVICGAGASLFESKEALRGLEQKALLFAGGSTITALSHYGISPHIAIALDPNEEEYDRLKESSAFEVPFIYSSRLHKDVLTSSSLKGGYLCSDTGGVFETWMQEELEIDPQSLGQELGIEALSVTTLAVPLAQHLGCNPIIFCGVDLSYRNKERYSPGVLPSSTVFLDELKQEKRSMEKFLRRKNGEGKLVDTLVKWVMEASCLSAYVKKQKGVSFFNASSQGLVIKGASQLDMRKFVETYCEEQHDLRGCLHTEGELARLPNLSEEKVVDVFAKLLTSLEECCRLFKQMLVEIEGRMAVIANLKAPLDSGLMTVIEMDVQEESAYYACLQCAFPAYERILERCYPTFLPLDTEEGRRCFLEKKQKIWTECLRVAEESLETVKRFVRRP